MAYTHPSHHGASPGWLARTEDWIDSYGRTGWIVALVLAMVLFWPVGLALLAFMLMRNKFDFAPRHTRCSYRTRHAPSGNTAFDAYRADTIRRLEDEQRSFEEFLARLRAARDKAEFDQFIDERADSDQTRTQDNDTPDTPRPA